MTILRYLFYLLIVRPITCVVLGLNVRHRERLPATGPAVIVANHNSHLDAMVLMMLFPMSMLDRLRPVAARDYFCRGKLLTWFALNVVGIIPFDRDLRGVRTDPLAEIDATLNAGRILILFPEGRRGEPEKMERFKTGIAHIAERHPQVPVVPVYLYGAGKALPRGEALIVPFFVDVFIGTDIHWTANRASFMDLLNSQMTTLAAEGGFEPWV